MHRMIRRAPFTTPVALLALVLAPAATAFNIPLPFRTDSPPPRAQSCTIIYAYDGHVALAGNNEDWNDPFAATITFLPAEEGKHGRVCLGWGPEWPQGGMNDQGLFYDAATAETVEVPRDPGKPDLEGSTIQKAMEECATVDEVLAYFDRYDVSGTWNGHYLIGDRFGNSAIIEPLTVIRKGGRYQVITNFLQSKTPPEASGDVRYHLVTGILEESAEFTVDVIRRTLSATHWEECGEQMTTTLYSNICDLTHGEIYLYNFHNFEDVVKINLAEELAKGERSVSIGALFPCETWAERRYRDSWVRDRLYEKVIGNGMDGPEGAIAFYHRLAFPDPPRVPYVVTQHQLNALGYQLLRDEKIDEAIGIFRLNVSEHPDWANGYDSLGEGYMRAERVELAIRNYEKSLQFDPTNRNAVEMLDQLRAR